MQNEIYTRGQRFSAMACSSAQRTLIPRIEGRLRVRAFATETSEIKFYDSHRRYGDTIENTVAGTNAFQTGYHAISALDVGEKTMRHLKGDSKRLFRLEHLSRLLSVSRVDDPLDLYARLRGSCLRDYFLHYFYHRGPQQD
jgi:hypothetical protein